MNPQNRHLTIGGPPGGAAQRPRGGSAGGGPTRAPINWVLALLTVPGAAIVMLFALGAVMSTDACSDRQCPHLGFASADFNTLFFGAPAVAAAVIVLSFFTAKRPKGVAVPLIGWALLVADVAMLAFTVSQ
jgi:hypothetical protein